MTLTQKSSLDFSGKQLRDRDFSNQILNNATFNYASLDRANFQGASLRYASFRGADLRQVNFADADLTGADFTGSDLTEAHGRELISTNAPTKRYRVSVTYTITEDFYVDAISDEAAKQKVSDDQCGDLDIDYILAIEVN